MTHKIISPKEAEKWHSEHKTDKGMRLTTKEHEGKWRSHGNAYFWQRWYSHDYIHLSKPSNLTTVHLKKSAFIEWKLYLNKYDLKEKANLIIRYSFLHYIWIKLYGNKQYISRTLGWGSLFNKKKIYFFFKFW